MTPELLLGASGQLGSAFSQILEDAISPTHDEFNLSELTHDSAREFLTAKRPSVVINCAAFTAVDKAEKAEQEATRVNGEAVGVLAEVTADQGIPLITFSTDYVFDGTATRPYVESDKPNPINAYGRSKLIGEELALRANARSLVVRTSWLLSGTHDNFVSAILRAARKVPQLRVVNDQTGCPTFAAELATWTMMCWEQGGSGLLHLVNSGATTWYGLALAAIAEAGMATDKVHPCSTAEYPSPARRPHYSVLGSDRIASLDVEPMPPWREGLPEIVGATLNR